MAAGAITFRWNGLSFNAAAELAEEGRSGTAIAIQQTALFGAASITPPVFGWLVSATSWRVGFWGLAVGPALCWLLLRPLARPRRRARPSELRRPEFTSRPQRRPIGVKCGRRR